MGSRRGRCIAMWSGPRNISTAMMRSWENRSDTRVSDEPFYGAYLEETGLEHPGRDEILESMELDPAAVAAALVADPGAGRIHYQKHMTHHMLAGFDLGFLEELDHAFLLRDPDEVVASYGRVRDRFTAQELGFARQREIFDRVWELRGAAPPVIEGSDLVEAPESMLRQLCERLDVGFDRAMLRWPAGPRESDGVWARHWYASVEKSTGFTRVPRPTIELDDRQRRIADQCRPHYEHLRAHRIRPDD